MQGTVYIKLGNDRVPLELGSRFCVVYSTTDPMNSTEEGSFLATKCDKKYHAICKGKKRGIPVLLLRSITFSSQRQCHLIGLDNLLINY